MEMQNAFENLNWLAIAAVTFLSFIIGGLWYSPVLFGKPWAKENGLSDEKIKESNMIKIFGGSFLLTFVAAFNLAMFLGPTADIIFGLTAGFLVGFGWVATSLGTLYLFERKSLKLFFINAGYHLVTFTLMGMILGAWK
jgi:hypothetical protein